MNISKISILNISCKNFSNVCPSKKLLPKIAKEESKAEINLAKIEKKYHKIEYLMRIIANRFMDLFESKNQKMLTESISEIKPEANETYLLQSKLISRLFASDKVVDINIEDRILEKVAQNGSSNIFIMNHSDQKRDPSMLAVISTLLLKAYSQSGKTNNFPLPKIILNKDILKTMNPKKRKAFEVLGAVGIDANIFCADKKVNAKHFCRLSRIL